MATENDNNDLQYSLIFHGGAGNISTNADNAKKRIPMAKVMKQILKSAYNYCQLGLKGELTAIDIAEKVVMLFEKFNLKFIYVFLIVSSCYIFRFIIY